MDPLVASLVLFAGLVLVAAAGTGIAAAGSPAAPSTTRPAPEPRTPAYDPAVAAAIFCPREGADAEVRLGVDRSGPLATLTVLRCERFGDGPVTCEMECLEAPVPA